MKRADRPDVWVFLTVRFEGLTPKQAAWRAELMRRELGSRADVNLVVVEAVDDTVEYP